MSDAFGHCHSFAAERQTLVGITQQPMDHCAQAAGAHAGIVPAIKETMRAVPVGIIEPAPRLAVPACGRRVAGKQASCPGTVMRLQAQFVVSLVCGQLEQSVGQSAGAMNLTRTADRLPKTANCHELLTGIALLLGKLAGALVSLCRLDRTEPFGREQRRAAG